MRERREIARGADRALAGNDRDHAAREHRLRAVSSVSGRTPEAPCARLPSFSAIIRRVTATGGRLADAGRMRQHDVALERGEIGRLDAHGRELAEAGVDAVDRLAAREDALRPPRRSPRRGRLAESSATSSPRQIARQSASVAVPARKVTVIGLSRRAHAAD